MYKNGLGLCAVIYGPNIRDLEESRRVGTLVKNLEIFRINEKNIIRLSYVAKNFSNPSEAVIHLDLRHGG